MYNLYELSFFLQNSVPVLNEPFLYLLPLTLLANYQSFEVAYYSL